MLGNNHPKFLMVVAFLMSMTGSFSANMKQNIQSGKVNPRDAQLAVRKVVAAGGTVNLLENAGQASVRGKNDFDGNRLTNGKNFVVTDLTINYGTAADDTFEGAVDYSTALPIALKNANLVISQDEKVIRKISIARIQEAKSSDHRLYELKGLFLLKEETTTSISIEFPENASFGLAGGTSAYVEVILDGFETKIING